MPTTETNGFLDHALQAHQNRLGPVVSSNYNFGMPGKNRELFITAFFTERRENVSRST